jgi:hypothetical protein
LDNAKLALEFHGVDSFYPNAEELTHVFANWADVKAHIEKIDLDVYKAYEHLTTNVLKDDRIIRPIDRLHVQDLIIYTAIVLILRDCVEQSRLPVKEKKSFSYRAPHVSGRLYDTSNNYEKYRKATEARLKLTKTKFVTTIDITDFFPRIYQHRLENAIQSFAKNIRETDANRILCKTTSKIQQRHKLWHPYRTICVTSARGSCFG